MSRYFALFCLVLGLMASRASAMDLDDPSEPWLRNPVGVTQEVPAPFEKLSSAGDTVSCWGRKYELGGLLPRQVTSQGEALLAGPMRLIFAPSGGPASPVVGQGRIGLVRDDRAGFSGLAQIGPVGISASGWLEYDGLMQLKLAVRADAPLTVDTLAVEIPLRPETARYFHISSQWGKYIYDRVGSAPDWRFQSDWQALTWIGDDYRGLTFVTERPSAWTGPADEALRIARQDTAVVLRANLINEPTLIEGERSYTLGLQATPGKPLPEGRHGRHPGQGGVSVTPEIARSARKQGQTIALIWHSDCKWFSYPQPAEAEAFRAAVRAYHEAGMRVVVYVTLSGTGPESEVFKRNADQWRMEDGGKPLFGEESVEGQGHGMVSTCPAGTYADWLVWAVDRAMAEFDLDGVYIDNAGPYYCDNPRHGCGSAEGRRYPYFANRDLHKRLWTVVQTRKPGRGIIWEHNSRTSNSLNLTFVDIYSDGEHFRVKSEGTPEQITRTLLDITATGRQWGAQPCFLPSALNLREQYTDWLLARLLPFGNVLMSQRSWMDYSRLSPVLRARLDFGLDSRQVEWFTPEAPPKWLTARPDSLLLGAYVASDGAVLATIGNPTEDRVAARIDLAPVAGRLGGEVEVTDALTDVYCPPIGETLVLTVPADSFRVIRIRRR